METFFPVSGDSVRNILSRLGDKWSLPVLALLRNGDAMRFSDLHKALGHVSERMLTVTLRSLETDGLLNRKVYPEVPPRVEYRLAKPGEELIPHLDGLANWVQEYMSDAVTSKNN